MKKVSDRLQDGLIELARVTRLGVRHRRQGLCRRHLGRKSVIPPSVHFKLRTERNRYINSIRYDQPADPYKTINVDPTEVEYEPDLYRDAGLGRVVGGEWDTREELRSLKDEYPRITRGLRQRFVEDNDWEDTIYYTEIRDRIESQGSHMGYNSPDEFLETRCEYVDELFESIRDDGYRPNFEAGHEAPEADDRSDRTLYKHGLEPLVAIGRHGEIYWREGFHRLTIAQILEIESIPVNVLARHSKWQQLRDVLPHPEINDESLQEHPDLQDVL